MQDVKFIISVVRGFVSQGRDHAPDDLHVFCPNFCWQVLKNTFGDTKVYSSLLSRAQAPAFLQGKASQKWLKPYRWGINTGATIPISYVLLKEKKKQPAVARPIILQQLHLWQVVSCSKHCVEHFASCSISWQLGASTFFQELHAFLCNAPIDIHVQQHNHDLAGFSPSLPNELLPSRMQTSQRFPSLYTCQPQSPSFECFKGALNDTRSEQESFGSKICVNFVSCPCIPHCSLHEESLQTAERIGHSQPNVSFIGQYCCLLLGTSMVSEA